MNAKLALLISPAALAFACGPEGTALFISDDQEAEIGAEVHQQVIAEYPLIEDSEIQSWVTNLGNRLAAASESERAGVNYQFFVIDTEEVNAFAAPGGYIYITRGLINAADNEAEVAGVMGHEVGHVAHRHSVAQIERQMAAQGLTSIFFGDSIAAEVADFATSFVLGTQYSQEQEYDADDQGVAYSYEAGFNPYGFVDFFYKLDELSGGSTMPAWLSSHPPALERAARAENNIDAIDGSVSRDDDDLEWEETGDFDSVQQALSF